MKDSPVACIMPVPILSVLLPESSLVNGITIQCIRNLGVEVSSCPKFDSYFVRSSSWASLKCTLPSVPTVSWCFTLMPVLVIAHESLQQPNSPSLVQAELCPPAPTTREQNYLYKTQMHFYFLVLRCCVALSCCGCKSPTWCGWCLLCSPSEPCSLTSLERTEHPFCYVLNVPYAVYRVHPILLHLHAYETRVYTENPMAVETIFVIF